MKCSDILQVHQDLVNEFKSNNDGLRVTPVFTRQDIKMDIGNVTLFDFSVDAFDTINSDYNRFCRIINVRCYDDHEHVDITVSYPQYIYKHRNRFVIHFENKNFDDTNKLHDFIISKSVKYFNMYKKVLEKEKIRQIKKKIRSIGYKEGKYDT